MTCGKSENEGGGGTLDKLPTLPFSDAGTVTIPLQIDTKPQFLPDIFPSPDTIQLVPVAVCTRGSFGIPSFFSFLSFRPGYVFKSVSSPSAAFSHIYSPCRFAVSFLQLVAVSQDCTRNALCPELCAPLRAEESVLLAATGSRNKGRQARLATLTRACAHALSPVVRSRVTAYSRSRWREIVCVALGSWYTEQGPCISGEGGGGALSRNRVHYFLLFRISIYLRFVRYLP